MIAFHWDKSWIIRILNLKLLLSKAIVLNVVEFCFVLAVLVWCRFWYLSSLLQTKFKITQYMILAETNTVILQSDFTLKPEVTQRLINYNRNSYFCKVAVWLTFSLYLLHLCQIKILLYISGWFSNFDVPVVSMLWMPKTSHSEKTIQL